MAETLTDHHGVWQWNFADMQRDLEQQGGLKDIVIDPLTMRDHIIAGSFGDNRFAVTWLKDELLLISMQEFSQELVDAFSAVVEYQPFCRYTSVNNLKTVEWDKIDPAGCFRTLEDMGYTDLQRLPRRDIAKTGLAQTSVGTNPASQPLRFSVAPGVGAAFANMGDTRAYYVFNGDLHQMGTIYTALLEAGFKVVKSDVYPGFPRSQVEEYKRALRYVYENRIAGWWNQEKDLIKHEICTQKEYDKALGRKPKRSLLT